MWICSKCGARVAPSFDTCWRCGTTYQGAEDPDFVTADQAPPVEDPSAFLKLDVGKFAEEEVAGPPVELANCFGSNVVAEAQFVANELSLEGIPATLQNVHDGGVGLPGNAFSLYPCRVVVLAEHLPRALLWVKRFRDRKATRGVMPG